MVWVLLRKIFCPGGNRATIIFIIVSDITVRNTYIYRKTYISAHANST